MDLLLEPPEETHHVDSFILAQQETVWTSDPPELQDNKCLLS